MWCKMEKSKLEDRAKKFRQLVESQPYFPAPFSDGSRGWIVNMADGKKFGCKTQTYAQILADLQSIKKKIGVK